MHLCYLELSSTSIGHKPLWCILEILETNFLIISIKAFVILISIVSLPHNLLYFFLILIYYLNLCSFLKMWHTHFMLVYLGFGCNWIIIFLLSCKSQSEYYFLTLPTYIYIFKRESSPTLSCPILSGHYQVSLHSEGTRYVHCLYF